MSEWGPTLYGPKGGVKKMRPTKGTLVCMAVDPGWRNISEPRGELNITQIQQRTDRAKARIEILGRKPK